MPKFRRCSYCGSDMEPGSGWMYVSKRGDILWFCSSKCRKNYLKLGRPAVRQAWVRG